MLRTSVSFSRRQRSLNRCQRFEVDRNRYFYLPTEADRNFSCGPQTSSRPISIRTVYCIVQYAPWQQKIHNPWSHRHDKDCHTTNVTTETVLNQIPSMAEEDIEQGAIAEGGTSGKKRLKKISSHTPMEILSGGVAVVAVATSVTAMILNPVTPVFIAGALSSLIGPYAYYQQTKLTDIVALKETHEAVKREVDRLTAENARLNETVGDLSDTIDRLEDVEQALDVITQTQGQSVAAFAEQVKENRNILGQMQKNLRANVLFFVSK